MWGERERDAVSTPSRLRPTPSVQLKGPLLPLLGAAIQGSTTQTENIFAT